MSGIRVTDPTHPDYVTDDPRANGRKIMRVLTDGGYADLFRKITAGPSGQTHNLHVARIRATPYGPFEVAISDPSDGIRAGYADRTVHDGAWWWSITAETYDRGWRWLGYAETLSAGADFLINGLSVATGRHDSRRLSQVAIRTAEQVHTANARKHAEQCVLCRDSGQHNGWIDCVAR